MLWPGGLSWLGMGLPAEEGALSGLKEPCLICLEMWPRQRVHSAMWAGAGDLNLIIGLCFLLRGAVGMSPCVHLAKQRMVFGVFFLAPAGLAGNGSHEGSRSYVLQQQGLGSAVAAGGGVVTEHRVFSFMPAGVSFPEELNMSCSWNWD